MENNNALMTNGTPSAPAVFSFFDPTQFETMQRVCHLFANSELVPDMYKISANNPKEKAIANCMIAIEMAQRIGASPLMIMQNMIIIYGKPSWSSKFLISTVNTCGRFNPLKYRFTDKGMLGKVDYTDYVWNQASRSKQVTTKTYDGTKIMDIECVAYTSAKGSDELLESSPVSVRLAIQEGWYTKSGSKWVTMTRQMLMYRAASFWTNAYAPELSMGMKTVEEVQDIIDVPYEDVTEKLAVEKAESANKVAIGFDSPKAEQPAEETPAPAATEQAAKAPEKAAPASGKAGKAELFEQPGF